MNNTVYNAIGSGYNTTRRADPYIAGKLYDFLAPKPNGLYLDIGCGTGNYLQAMLTKGINMMGIDPSEVMINAAKAKGINTSLICSDAEHIPFPDKHFDGIMAVLTLHHWKDKLAGLKELKRVIKKDGNLVFFTFTPQQLQGYWLKHYFPDMIADAAFIIPDLSSMQHLFKEAGFNTARVEAYSIKDDLQDHFMYSNKYRPEQYLLQNIRDGISAFRLAKNQDEIAKGLQLLHTDIQTGIIHEIIKQNENDSGDYLFLVATIAN